MEMVNKPKTSIQCCMETRKMKTKMIQELTNNLFKKITINRLVNIKIQDYAKIA